MASKPIMVYTNGMVDSLIRLIAKQISEEWKDIDLDDVFITLQNEKGESYIHIMVMGYHGFCGFPVSELLKTYLEGCNPGSLFLEALRKGRLFQAIQST